MVQRLFLFAAYADGVASLTYFAKALSPRSCLNCRGAVCGARLRFRAEQARPLQENCPKWVRNGNGPIISVIPPPALLPHNRCPFLSQPPPRRRCHFSHRLANIPPFKSTRRKSSCAQISAVVYTDCHRLHGGPGCIPFGPGYFLTNSGRPR